MDKHLYAFTVEVLGVGGVNLVSGVVLEETEEKALEKVINEYNYLGAKESNVYIVKIDKESLEKEDGILQMAYIEQL